MLFKGTNGSSRHADPSRLEDLANLKITDAKPGDTLSIVGLGDQFADLDFTIDRRSMIEAGEKKWTELSGTYQERRVVLEVHNDDTVQVFASVDGKTITLDQLGLSEDDLAEIDARQNPADSFEFEDKTWMYRWSRETGIFRDNEFQGAYCYTWRFEDEKGERILTIRKFEGEPFLGFQSQKVNPGDITVYRG